MTMAVEKKSLAVSRFWYDGIPIDYADQVAHIHFTSSTSKLVLTVDVAGNPPEPVRILMLPTQQLFSLARTLIKAAIDPSLEEALKESAPVAAEVEELRKLLRDPPSTTTH